MELENAPPRRSLRRPSGPRRKRAKLGLFRVNRVNRPFQRETCRILVRPAVIFQRKKPRQTCEESPALEKVTQRQTHRLCQEPPRIRGSANTLSDGGAPTSSVFQVRLGVFRLPARPPARLPLREKKKEALQLCCFSLWFQKKMVPASAFSPLYVRCFVPLPPRGPQNRFLWFCPNEALSPFPWRQSQNCQVPPS